MIIIVDALKFMAGWLNRGVGSRGERVAAGYLKRSGYRVLGRNLRNRFGEVDILAEAPDRQTIVVIEVKSGIHPYREAPLRSELAPEVRVGRRKRRRLVALAGQIARRYHLDPTANPVRYYGRGHAAQRTADCASPPGGFRVTCLVHKQRSQA